MPRATPTLLLVCDLHRWSPRQGNEDLAEETITQARQKWEKPYSEVREFVNVRMSIAIVRATPLCLRGSRIPTSKMRNRLPQWENKAGLGLARRHRAH